LRGDAELVRKKEKVRPYWMSAELVPLLLEREKLPKVI